MVQPSHFIFSWLRDWSLQKVLQPLAIIGSDFFWQISPHSESLSFISNTEMP